MKAILEFNLPDEEEYHLSAVNGMKYKMAIDSLYDKVFRPLLKYENPIIGEKLSPEHYEVIKSLWVLIAEHFEV